MKREDPLVAHCLDLLAPLGPVTAKRMFGGYGLFLEGIMFALIGFEQLYFKVDDATEAEFAATDSEPFVYQGRDKPVKMSYWTAPSDAMESPESLLPWAEKALAAARRAAAKKKPKRKKS